MFGLTTIVMRRVWMVVRRWRCTVMMMVGSVIPVIVPVIQYDARVE